jgi:dolichol-phosphate mannosyltransferase
VVDRPFQRRSVMARTGQDLAMLWRASKLARPPHLSPQVCVLVPTRNEAGNIPALLARLGPTVALLSGEVLFVDDSDDDTPSVIAAARHDAAAPVRLVHRVPAERFGGLGGAVQTGLATVTATWTVVMDADLQHPPELVTDLIAAGSGADLVVASRYIGNGSAAGLSSRFRSIVSAGSIMAARLLFPRALAGVTDPMSGFFAVRTAAVDAAALRPKGFKILLEVLIRTPRLRVAELPFAFAERHAGQSKASWREAFRYLRQLIALRAATVAVAGGRDRPGATGSLDDRTRRVQGAGGSDTTVVTRRSHGSPRSDVKPARTVGS